MQAHSHKMTEFVCAWAAEFSVNVTFQDKLVYRCGLDGKKFIYSAFQICRCSAMRYDSNDQSEIISDMLKIKRQNVESMLVLTVDRNSD